MNIQLMLNVAVDIIEQRLAPLANVLTRNNHTADARQLCAGDAVCDRRKFAGADFVSAVSIDGASAFGQFQLRPILLPTFELTIGLVALISGLGASASLPKWDTGAALRLTGCRRPAVVYRLRDNGATNIFLGGMGFLPR